MTRVVADALEKSESVRTRSGRYIWYRRHNRQNPTIRTAARVRGEKSNARKLAATFHILESRPDPAHSR